MQAEACTPMGLISVERACMSFQLEQVAGLLLGHAAGDAVGLPREGLSRRRAMRMFGSGPLRHRLIFGGWGMVSDDTEHLCMAAQALIVARGDPDRFARSLAWRLRGWFACLPAGIGMATARACIKLWLGFPPGRSGVHSAGNGPAMRASIIGLWAADDIALLKRLVTASTRLTHTDPVAEQAALAIALAAAFAVRVNGDASRLTATAYLEFAKAHIESSAVIKLIEAVVAHRSNGSNFDTFLQTINCDTGVSGYILHTMPACLFAWLSHPDDYRSAVEMIVCAGGDTDTTGAIVGGLVGITAGTKSIPNEWLRISEWPRSRRWLQKLSVRLWSASMSPATGEPVAIFWPAIPFRNAVFLLVVLAHGVRRLFPPY